MHHPKRGAPDRQFFSSAGALILAACATVGPDYAAPDPAGLATSDLQVDGAANSIDREPAQRWWAALEDETLNRLIETGYHSDAEKKSAD